MIGLKPFLGGLLVGGCLSCIALQYHVVRSSEGLYLVPRTPKPSLTQTYADTRNWTAERWSQNPAIANALRANGAADLLASQSTDRSTGDDLQDAIRDSVGTPFIEDDLITNSGSLPTFPADIPGRLDHSVDRLQSNASGAYNRTDSLRTDSRDGFLDDVRSELDQTFGDWDTADDRSEANAVRDSTSGYRPRSNGEPSLFDDLTPDIQNARNRIRSSIDDSLDNDILSDSLDRNSPRETYERESYERSDSTVPEFNSNPTLYTPKSNPSGSGTPQTTPVSPFKVPDWSDDPWATPKTNSGNRSSSIDIEDGWSPTGTSRQSNNAVTDTLDRLNSAASRVAQESVQRAKQAATNPLQQRIDRVRSSALDAVGSSVQKRTGTAANWIDKAIDTDDGLFSPFKEVDK